MLRKLSVKRCVYFSSISFCCSKNPSLKLLTYQRSHSVNLPSTLPSRSTAEPTRPGTDAYKLLFGTTARPLAATATAPSSVEEEWEEYCDERHSNIPDIETVDIVAWWDVSVDYCIGKILLTFRQSNRNRYPILFQWAMNFLPAQASSVPSERVFSSSAETDTCRRNRIAPDMMEKCQMLKFMLKKTRLDFTESIKCTEEDLEQENNNEDAGLDACHENINEGVRSFDDIIDIFSTQDEDVLLRGEEVMNFGAGVFEGEDFADEIANIGSGSEDST